MAVQWLYNITAYLDANFMRFGSLFLLVFIPLYPKFPLIDIWQTWVFIRVEDLLVTFLGLFFVIETMRRTTNIRSPLTVPIIVYWTIGGVSVVHSLIRFVPLYQDLFGHLVVLHYMRRIEYMLLFFIVFTSIRSVREAKQYVMAFLIALTGVVAYGFAQWKFGWCAFLTMNQEFAKGECLSGAPRISSTFAGHYDLGAYLVLAIAIAGSMFLGISGIRRKIIYFILGTLSFGLLLLTESRISFFAALFSVFLLLLMHKKKWLLVPLIIAGVAGIILASGLSDRFGKTFRIEPVVYDVRTNTPIALIADFKHMKIVQDVLNAAEIKKTVDPSAPTPTPFEELPLGTGFLDVPYVYRENPIPQPLDPKLLYSGEHPNVTALARNYVIKPTVIYDISFTTRSQGQWPKAIEAFKRNIWIGSGYSAADIAVDNNYLRILAETGIIGFGSYFLLFAIVLLIVHQTVRKKSTPFIKAFMIGMGAGIIGLMVNAVLIDVFEASKLAFVLWSLIGVTVGMYAVGVPEKESLMTDVRLVMRSHVTAVLLLTATGILILYPSLTNYFVADDFTWLKWAIDADPYALISYFRSAEGFFYRPLTRLLVYGLYQFFGMNPVGYHTVSMIAHIATSLLVYGIARRLTRRALAGLIAGFLFLLMPAHAETVLWMSGFSGLFAGLFYAGSLYALIRSSLIDYTKSPAAWCMAFLAYVTSVVFAGVSILFYEVAFSLPFVATAYLVLFAKKKTRAWAALAGIPFFVVAGIYAYIRTFIADAHGLSGDYNYDLVMFPLNAAGNVSAYIAEMVAGQHIIPVYDSMRQFFRDQTILTAIIVAVIAVALGIFYRKARSFAGDRIVLFGLLWIFLALLPVMGLGNIAERYIYISSVGFVIVCARIFVGKKIISVMLFLTLLVWYIVDISRTIGVWRTAGETSYSILRSVTMRYRELPPSSQLYYIGVPIRYERAWIFPVGLDDALWAHYRDDSLQVFRTESLDTALVAKQTKTNVFIFVYSAKYGIAEIDGYGNIMPYEPKYLPSG